MAWIRTEHFDGPVEAFASGTFTGLTSHEQQVRQVCRNWLANQSEFSFQTSGSTGTPKTIQFSRSQLDASAALSIEAFQLQAGQTSLCCLDVNLVAGFMMIVRSLVSGMNIIVVAPGPNPLQGIEDDIDFMAVVPYQMSYLLAHERSRLDRTGVVIVGGAPLTADIIPGVQELKCKVYATYGMTETLTHVALQPLNGLSKSGAFALLPGVQGHQNEEGCLIIQAPHLGTPVVTHDLVEFTDPGHFRWIGRMDDVINSGGIKFQPAILEAKLSLILQSIPVDRRFVVTGMPDPVWGTALTLVIEGPPLSEAVEQTITNSYYKQLVKKEYPKAIRYLPDFPETSSQKIDRIKIRSMIS